MGRPRRRTGCWCTAGATTHTSNAAGTERGRREPYAETFTHTVRTPWEAQEGLRPPGRGCRHILLLDVVFRLDSITTTTGTTDEITVILLAIVIAAGPISRFVDQHLSARIPAPSFLPLIGMNPIAKGYPSFAMRFSVFVEMVKLRLPENDDGA